MKFLLSLVSTLVCASAVVAMPQLGSANDVKQGLCKKITLIYARASTEQGNMGSMGPQVCKGLKSKFPGSVACQGVGPAYRATLQDNVLPAGTSKAAITEAQGLFQQAIQKCPTTTFVAGGFSQGTAVMMNSISKLPDNIKSKIAGVVLFGYTKNKQTKSSIPNYPVDRVKVFCAKSDGVCGGALVVTAGHFSYVADGTGSKAVNFLTARLKGGAGGAAEVQTEPATE